MNVLLSEITWRPRIGDPDALGWGITLAYLIAGVLSVLAGRNRQAEVGRKRGSVQLWFVLAALMFALGLNKQLDLQTLLLDIGKEISKDGGWSSQRKAIRIVFMLVGGLIGLAGLLLSFYAVRHRWRHNFLVFIGIACLLTFVVIRGAPATFVARFLNHDLAFWVNNGLEIAGTFLVGLGALLNTRPSKLMTATGLK